jgi:hypothetical protein
VTQPPREQSDALTPTAPADRPWPSDERDTVVAVFGDTARAGAWLPPARLDAIAGFARVKLDFRDADLVDGPTEIRCFGLFGNVELLVPRGLEVELSGVSLFGSIEHRSREKAGRRLLDRMIGRPTDPPAPPAALDDDDRWLVVSGWAVFGNVRVTIVDP